MIKRMTSCFWTTFHVTAVCKEVDRTALLPISVPLPAPKEGMYHNQVQALGHLIPPVHSFSLHAGRARHRTAWNGHSSICKLTGFGKSLRFEVFAEIAVT